MIKYILRRLIQAIPIVFGVSILSFLLVTLAPGGPTAALALDPRLSPAMREAEARRLGVNDPFHIQYVRWLIGDDWMYYDRDGDGVPERGTQRGFLRGDFGYSYVNSRPVIDLFLERLGATLELGIFALLFGLMLGVPIGIIAAVNRGGIFDSVTRVLAVIINSVPIFWMGLMLILIFGAYLNILPMGSRGPTELGGLPPLHERLNHLILPVIVLGAGGLAGYSRYMRASMLDVINQDYMRTAKAKGLRPRAMWFRHGARNALIPLATFLGPAITGLWGGAPITETIFSWPGVGRLYIQAINQQDFPLIMLVVIFSAIATIVGFILSDVLYALIDPRIRF